MGYKYLNKIKENEDISINTEKEKGKSAINKIKKRFLEKKFKFPNNDKFVYSNK